MLEAQIPGVYVHALMIGDSIEADVSPSPSISQ